MSPGAKKAAAKRLRYALETMFGSVPQAARQLGGRRGFSRESMWRWTRERAPEIPTGENLYLLCVILNCSADWLLFGTEEKEPAYLDNPPRTLLDKDAVAARLDQPPLKECPDDVT